MTRITPESVRELLSKTGQRQTELAQFLGIDDDKLSKSLRGLRRFQVSEVDKIKLFFGLDAQGFSEPGKQPTLDTSSIPSIGQAVKNVPNDELNKIKLAVVGDRVQIAGTYDRDGLVKLIDRLQKVHDLLD